MKLFGVKLIPGLGWYVTFQGKLTRHMRPTEAGARRVAETLDRNNWRPGNDSDISREDFGF